MANTSEVKEDILKVAGHKKERNATSQEGMKVTLQIYFLKIKERRERNLKIEMRVDF